MRSAICLLGQSIEIDGEHFIIHDFCLTFNSAKYYVKLKREDGTTLNYDLNQLTPYLKTNFRI